MNHSNLSNRLSQNVDVFDLVIIYLGYVVLIYHDPVWLEPSLEEDFDQRVLDNVGLGTTVILYHLLDADHGAVGGDARLLVISRRGCETVAHIFHENDRFPEQFESIFRHQNGANTFGVDLRTEVGQHLSSSVVRLSGSHSWTRRCPHPLHLRIDWYLAPLHPTPR